ncbi:hypothetical protein QE152_g22393 [Popillia japonica]|uniref:Uncharacterized protein n=1 Tax=Popillia japonica TaxID=7064 RepID=A0AAW1KIT7_POPJA
MDEKIELIQPAAPSHHEEIDIIDSLENGELVLENLTENSSLNSPRYDEECEDVDSIEELLLEQKSEFCEVFDTKRKELDKIQNDLNELMDRLNNFLAEDSLSYGDTESLDAQNYDDDLSEKQDGPQEKELMKQKGWNEIPVEEMYVSDGLNPPEINWDILAPFIQNVVGDLKKIRNLNQMTSSVLQRIRNITGVTEAQVTDEN